MPPLASDLRRQLESVVVQARDKSETAARAAFQRWAVDAAKPFGHFSLADRAFRKQLRARGKQAGDRRSPDGHQGIDQLTQQLAYEYWHRMLFARFLAENHLLMHPDGVAVTLAECEELAPSEKAADGFVLAARYASRMLPQIFRVDDVLLEVEFPVNERLPLEKLLAGLPSQVFTADDSLGWVYQFWQSKKKDEVNKSGQKIDGRSLPAVTQLFTEHYMVEFLLHNTIGAWWSARHGLKRSAGLEPRREENGTDIEPRMKHGLNTDKDNKKKFLILIRVSSVFHPWLKMNLFHPWPRSSLAFDGATTAPRPLGRSRAGPRPSKSSPCSTPAAAAGISWWRASTCWCRCGCTTMGSPPRRQSMPCCERISLASRSTRVALRSPHSPWLWQPGSSLMKTASRLAIAPCPHSMSPARARVWSGRRSSGPSSQTVIPASMRGWSGSTTSFRRPHRSAR